MLHDPTADYIHQMAEYYRQLYKIVLFTHYKFFRELGFVAVDSHVLAKSMVQKTLDFSDVGKRTFYG